MSYRSILVPVDGSATAEHALSMALTLARRSHARLRLVHVLPPLASVYTEAPLFDESEYDIEARIKERLRGYLDTLATRIAKRLKTEVDTLLLEGEVATTLLAHTAETNPDLVVMTTHGRGPLGRFWLGSVADELVRQLHAPLLLLRSQDETSADFETESPLKSILIPLDGTKLAEHMIRPAVMLGRLTGAEFTLLRVIKPVPRIAVPTGSTTIDLEAQSLLSRVDEIQERLRKEALGYLDGIARSLKAEGLKVRTKVVLDDRPGMAILKEAETLSVDMVALETHGRHGLARLLMGSVADKVIRGASVPVLVHRPHHG